MYFILYNFINKDEEKQIYFNDAFTLFLSLYLWEVPESYSIQNASYSHVTHNRYYIIWLLSSIEYK